VRAPALTVPSPSLEEFKARLPIAEVIGRWVKLSRRGREHWGCCPFHQEKTPSFHVVEDKGFYHCFGCGAHGNAIDFVIAVEGLGFSEALDRLAELTGIRAPRREGPTTPPPDRSLHEVMEAAAAWLERQLREPVGRGAQAYLDRRGVPPPLARRFRLGYAPPGRQALRQALNAQGIGDERLLAAGLLATPEEGGEPFDRFRDRLMFPIADSHGRLVGFGGRALGEAKAKYLNSPETELFHKGRLLYNLAAAARPARAAKALVVVEGYMDVIALTGAGIEHVVAPLGTAVTEDQLVELWRHAEEPVLCLDGDAAGLRAAERAAERALPLLRPGRSLRFALLPEGEDPDSLVRRDGAEALRAALEKPLTLVDFLWRQSVMGVPLDTPERRAAAERGLMARLATIAEPDVRGHYRRELGQRLRALWRPAAGRVAPAPAPARLALGAGRAERLAEQALLEPFLLDPTLLQELEEELALLPIRDSELASVQRELLAWYATGPSLDGETLRTHLTRHGFGRVVERILRLRMTARGAARAAAVEDVREAWRIAAARHDRSLARGDPSPEDEGAAPADDLIARIGALNRMLEDGRSRDEVATAAEPRARPAEDMPGGR
jgi:DNA primase